MTKQGRHPGLTSASDQKNHTTVNAASIIRIATEKDAAPLATAIEHLITGIPYYNALAKQHEILRYSAGALALKIKEDPYSIILACNGNEIAGFCISRFDDYTIWLEWFGVIEKYRGAGITKQLLRALENTVAERECHKIWCDCRTSNQPAIHLLSSTGYSQIATIKNHWYGQDFILWQKTVSS
jgi:ribosomal protein S18 acetylase RimI-like enzyme